jgi:hypothetical protein
LQQPPRARGATAWNQRPDSPLQAQSVHDLNHANPPLLN